MKRLNRVEMRRLLPPGETIVEVIVGEHLLRVQTADGRWVETPMEWYPSLQRMPEAERQRHFHEYPDGVDWPNGYCLSLDGMKAGAREGGEVVQPALRKDQLRRARLKEGRGARSKKG